MRARVSYGHGGNNECRLASLGSGTVCLVAAAPAGPHRLVAAARCVRIDAETAELELAVRDDHQRAGLGHLLGALVLRARKEGTTRLRAVVLLGNTPMLRLLQRYGWTLAVRTEDFSVAFPEISAIGGMPGWPEEPAGR